MTVCFNSKNKIYIVMRKYENEVTWTFGVIKWVEKIKGGHFG